MVSLKASLRHQTITEILRDKGLVSIAHLEDRLGVSRVTVREDLKHLEGLGQLVRTRGGALSLPDQRHEKPVELAGQTMAAEKQAIGRAAAARVESGQTIIIDVGSTTMEMARALPTDLFDVVVVTNGLNIALQLEQHPGLTVVVTGGTLRPLQHSLVAPLGTMMFEKINADTAFIGCNGIDAERGFTNANLAEAEMKQAMIRSARETTVLADHSKLGHVASAFVAPLDHIDCVLTDDGVDPKTLGDLHSVGLNVVLADDSVSP